MDLLRHRGGRMTSTMTKIKWRLSIIVDVVLVLADIEIELRRYEIDDQSIFLAGSYPASLNNLRP